MSFDEWHNEVNKELSTLTMCGVNSTDDLGDPDWYCLFEDELTPKEAALRGLQEDDLWGAMFG